MGAQGELAKALGRLMVVKCRSHHHGDLICSSRLSGPSVSPRVWLCLLSLAARPRNPAQATGRHSRARSIPIRRITKPLTQAMCQPIRQVMRPSIRRRRAIVPIRQRLIWMDPTPPRAFSNSARLPYLVSSPIRLRTTLSVVWITLGGRRFQTPAALRPVRVGTTVFMVGIASGSQFRVQGEAVHPTAPLWLRPVAS